MANYFKKKKKAFIQENKKLHWTKMQSRKTNMAFLRILFKKLPVAAFKMVAPGKREKKRNLSAVISVSRMYTFLLG